MTTDKKFAVVLSGSGVYDGAEIHEATLALLAIAEQGVAYDIFAPDIKQHHVINHLTGEEMAEERNVLVEAARIARGKIQDLKALKMDNYDALIFPGGFGVAKNLCDFAFKGAACSVNEDVKNVIQSAHRLNKPIGAMCISPALISAVFEGVEVTIGSDPGTAEAIREMGGKHTETGHGGVVYDEKYNVYSTPCYMLDASIGDIAKGARNLVAAILK